MIRFCCDSLQLGDLEQSLNFSMQRYRKYLSFIEEDGEICRCEIDESHHLIKSGGICLVTHLELRWDLVGPQLSFCR